MTDQRALANAEITLLDAEKIQHLRLEGRLDASGVGDIEDRFQATTVAARKHAVVDLSGVSFIASKGIRMLVTAAKEMATAGHILVLLDPPALIDELLKAADLYRLIPVAYSENEAAIILAD